MTTVDPNAKPTTPPPTAEELFKKAVSQAMLQEGISIYQMGQVGISLAQGFKASDE
ncbi:hypothetical protein [Tabrizicola aquatica]|uniref:hypothetical protein n=1 Tax=Tabrizicola aquatica TaxID=909926 RepID=UPI0015E1735B|nr:hypothetical protein [Tabrizicola aquatica]